MLPTPSNDATPPLQDPVGVHPQGVRQARVGASHASPTPLELAYRRSGLVWGDLQPGCGFAASFYFLVASTAGDAGIAARALACIAEVLGCMARGEGGLRSGPAANREWASAFGHLESGDIAGGVRELAAERQKWMSR